jgi:hypothetical protein
MHRICDPSPKTAVSNWDHQTILASEWGFPAERFTSQAFWDAFEQILPENLAPAEDPLDQAQLRFLGLWKEKQLVGRRRLAYDTTHFYTYMDRSQDPHPCVLLHAGHLSVAICVSPSQSRLERSFHGTTHRRVAADSSSSSCSIHGKVRKALIARSMCYRSKLWRSRVWPRR